MSINSCASVLVVRNKPEQRFYGKIADLGIVLPNMLPKQLKQLLAKPIHWLFRGITVNDHILYAGLTGRAKTRVERVLKMKNSYEHVTATCELFGKLGFSDGKVILDVGGGSGNTARLFLTYFPKNEVHIFEPIGSNMNLIKAANLFGKVKLHEYALGDSEGELPFFITDNITSSSLLKPTSNSGYGSEIAEVSQSVITVKRLDSVISQESEIGIMKMDVQGFELSVLKGAGHLLENTDYVVMEVNNHTGYENSATYYELDLFMRENNFQLMRIFPGRVVDSVLMDWDVIYANVRLFK